MKTLTTLLCCIFLFQVLDAQPEGFHERTFTKDGFDRRYWVYVPSSYTGETPTPIVLNIPGFANYIDFFITFIKMHEVAEAEGFLYVVPEAVPTDTPFGFAPSWNFFSDPSGPDDFAYIEEVLLRVASEFAVDSRRVYTSGHSQGAFMNWLLACRLPGHFGAIGPVAGRLVDILSAGCPDMDTPAIPIAHIQGTADPNVPYGAATLPGLGAIMSVPDYIARWANLNGCATTTTETNLPDINLEDNSTVTRIEYEDCPDGKDVWLFRVNEGGHYWPNATDLPPDLVQFGNNNKDIVGGQVLWDFFAQHVGDAPPFELLNVEMHSTMGPLTDGKVLDHAFIPHKISVQLNPSMESVSMMKIQLSGPISWKTTQTEAPFTLFGNSGMQIKGRYLPQGDYTLTATPYFGGHAMEPMTVHFSVRGRTPSHANAQVETRDDTKPGILDSESWRAYPVPSRGEVTIMLPDLQPGEQVQLMLTDLQGRQVQVLTPATSGQRQIRLDRQQLNVPAGSYLLHGSSEVRTFSALKLVWQ